MFLGILFTNNDNEMILKRKFYLIDITYVNEMLKTAKKLDIRLEVSFYLAIIVL